MRLFKKFSIMMLSLILVLTGAIVLNGFRLPSQTVEAASGAEQKYFYLSDMPVSSSTGTYEEDKDFVTMKRGGGLYEETFVKNVVIVDNGSLTYQLKGLNAERFITYVGIDIAMDKKEDPAKSATVTISTDGVAVSTVVVETNKRYECLDISLTDVKNLTITVTGATSGARVAFANPKVFGANLLYGYTENNALELSNLPYSAAIYPAPIGQNIDVKIRENNQNKIYLSDFAGSTTDNPAKLGWDIEAIGAYYFSVQVETAGSVQFKMRYLVYDNNGQTTATEERLMVDSDGIITANGTYTFAIPAKATEIILATSGGATTFINPILYCNNYAILSDANMQQLVNDTHTGWDEAPIMYNAVKEGSATLDYRLENGGSAVAQFNKNVFIHAEGWVRYDLVNLHLTRFTSYVGIVSTKSTTNGDGVNFVANYYNYYTQATEYLRDPINDITYNNAERGRPLNYVDESTPIGTQSITLKVEARTNNDSDHAIWCAPIIFGNRISNPQTAVPKLEYNETNHYRGNEFTEAHNYGSYSFDDSQHSRTCMDCGYVQTSAHSHSTTVEVEPTCINQGRTRYTCVCGHTYTIQTENPNNHAGQIVNAGTASVHTWWSCCNVVVSSKHTIKSVQTKAPTCTETGTTTHSCDCGYSYTTELSALGHSMGEWYMSSFVTENQSIGQQRRDCKNCSYHETRETSANNTASLTVTETIGLNMYIDAQKYTNDANAYIELTYNHNKTGYTPQYKTDRKYLKNVITQSDQTYKFSMAFASGQISDTITITLYNSQGVVLYERADYSILEYCTNMINNKNSSDSLKNLCQSIINYGMQSIIYFNYYTDLPDSASAYIKTINGVSNTISNAPTASVVNGATNLSVNKYSLLALSDTGIRIYFNIANGGSIKDYSVELTPVGNSNMKVKTGSNDVGGFVEIYGIESAYINTLFTVTITHTSGTKTTISYSAANFLKSKIDDVNSAQQLKDFCLSIYQYNECSKNYFKEIGVI